MVNISPRDADEICNAGCRNDARELCKCEIGLQCLCRIVVLRQNFTCNFAWVVGILIISIEHATLKKPCLQQTSQDVFSLGPTGECLTTRLLSVHEVSNLTTRNSFKLFNIIQSALVSVF